MPPCTESEAHKGCTIRGSCERRGGCTAQRGRTPRGPAGVPCTRHRRPLLLSAVAHGPPSRLPHALLTFTVSLAATQILPRARVPRNLSRLIVQLQVQCVQCPSMSGVLACPVVPRWFPDGPLSVRHANSATVGSYLRWNDPRLRCPDPIAK